MKRACCRCKEFFDYSPRFFGVHIGVAKYICPSCAIDACRVVVSRHKERVGSDP